MTTPTDPNDLDTRIGPVTHDEAEQLALAYIDKAFNNRPKDGRRVRHSIPANPREDTDLRLTGYIRQQRKAEAAQQDALIKAFDEGVMHVLGAVLGDGIEFDEAEVAILYGQNPYRQRPETPEEVCARLGIDVPEWAREVRERVAEAAKGSMRDG